MHGGTGGLGIRVQVERQYRRLAADSHLHGYRPSHHASENRQGILAVGNVAVGGVAIAGLACGLVAVGGASFGLVLALGGAAVGLGISVGGLAVGSIAVGGAAIGMVYAIGGGAFGPAIIDGRRCDPAALEFVRRWLGSWALPPNCR